MIADLEPVLRHAPILTLRLALTHVQTIAGAERIYYAEKRGRARPEVLRAAARRIEELGGTQPERVEPLLEVAGQVIEAPAPRIVEAVGRGRRHPGW